ncbi:class I lanthipeptide [Chitinophaga oryzae]|uniref:Class I lanthipeptide n=1 Tax=Chitinophaga oryzae TaxID=2725414 RepID=A0AAE6ZEE4_9BACT|nr:class I lanthipeptide [Chitinophaga oryzae]QJB31114.1 class I lanthipeptide [Chitinophaga oryzae]QJB37599.1 class I lanthipeptide [Chitinophaga oryzae]
MKKKKVNLSKLTLNKEVIGNLSQEKITGGISSPRLTCLRTCLQTCLDSCFCTEISQFQNSCETGCNTTVICP